MLADLSQFCSVNQKFTGVARGCTGCTYIPRAEKKNFWAWFTGESHKCTPRQSKSPCFEDIFAGGGDLEGGRG